MHSELCDVIPNPTWQNTQMTQDGRLLRYFNALLQYGYERKGFAEKNTDFTYKSFLFLFYMITFLSIKFMKFLVQVSIA